MLKKVFQGPRKYYRSKNPSIIWFVLTYSCNSHCSYCYAQDVKSNKYLSFDYFEKAVQIISFEHIRRAILIGGEPTLFTDIDKVANRLRPLVKDILLVTNGIKLFSIDYVKILKEMGITEINISIESNRFLDNRTLSLKNSIEVFGQNSVSVILTLGKQNETYLKELIKEVEFAGVNKMAVNFALPLVTNPQITEEFACSPIDIAKKFIMLYEFIKKETEIHPIFYLNLPLCFFPIEFLKSVFSEGHAITGCHAMTGHGLVVDPYGKIIPCTHWVDVSDTNLDEDWENLNTKEKFDSFWLNGKPALWSKKLCQFRHQSCVNCKLWGDICWGGCPLLWLYYDPKHFNSYFDI